ncbi:MAG: nuclear transport factor 2 family protein [Candidatus Thorarchaeota archaeon]
MKRKTINQMAITLFVFTVFVSVLWFQASLAYGQEWTAVQKEILKAMETEWEFFKQGNLEKVMAMRHNNFINWPNDRPNPLWREAMEQSYKNWLDYDKPVAYKLRPLEIQIIGNVANVFYEYKWNGKMYSGHSRSMDTWIKQNNKWLKISSFGGSCDKLPSCILSD